MPKIIADKGFIFARVSSQEQNQDDRFSVPSQLNRLKKYANDNKIEVVEIFTLTESAFRGKRLKFKKKLDVAFKYAEASNKPVALIFDEEDRLTRRTISDVMNQIEKLIESNKIELHFRESNKCLHKNSSHGDILTFRIKYAVAEDESRNKSQKIKGSFKFKLQHKQYPGYTPVGYLNKVEKIDEDVLKRSIIPDPEKKILIKEAFKLYATGNYSIEELAAELRSKGLKMKLKKNRNGIKEEKPIGKSDLQWMLKNPFYTGKFRWLNPETGERELYQGAYEPLISEELFDRVQKNLNEKVIKFNTRHSTTKFFKFRRLIKCGFCGCVLTPNDLSTNFQNKKPGEEVYYRCSYSKKNTNLFFYRDKFGENHSGVVKRKGKKVYNCPQMYWREDELEAEIKNQFSLLHYDRKVFDELKKIFDKEFDTQIKLSKLQKDNLVKEINKLEKLKSGLIRQLGIEDFISIKLDLKTEVEQINREIKENESELKFLKDTENIRTDELVDTLSLCSNLEEQYENLSDMKKRELIITAFDKISVRRGEANGIKFDGAVNFVWTEPFNTLSEIGLEKAIKKGLDRLPESMRLKKSINNNKDVSIPFYSY